MLTWLITMTIVDGAHAEIKRGHPLAKYYKKNLRNSEDQFHSRQAIGPIYLCVASL